MLKQLITIIAKKTEENKEIVAYRGVVCSVVFAQGRLVTVQ
jgi:hypothetical protein